MGNTFSKMCNRKTVGKKRGGGLAIISNLCYQQINQPTTTDLYYLQLTTDKKLNDSIYYKKRKRE